MPLEMMQEDYENKKYQRTNAEAEAEKRAKEEAFNLGEGNKRQKLAAHKKKKKAEAQKRREDQMRKDKLEGDVDTEP